MGSLYRVLKPSYYDDFKCVGGECENTCCKGWVIPIDEVSYKRYKSVRGEYGDKLKDSIIINNSNNKSDTWYAEFKLNEDGKCSLLTENGLCSIYSELGEKNMCITCKKYPRLIKKYNDLCEKNLVMSCPEVARLLCEHRDPLDFVLSEEELNDWELLVKKDYVDKEIYDLFFEVRSFYIDIIQYRDISLWKRIYFVLRMQDEVKKLFESKNNKGIENIIQRTKQEIDSEEVLKELDKIEQISQVSHVKIRVLSLCLLNDISKKELNESYEILSDFIGEEEIETVNCRWVNMDNEYNEKYKMYDYIYENYIVYYLYENYFKSDKDNIIGGLIISYMLLKAMNLLKYIKYGKIDINDIKENIHNLSRLVDNSKEYFNEIIRKLGERGLWTKEYLLILMR